MRERWDSYRAQSGSRLALELGIFEVRDLHERLFAREGLKRGEWDAALVLTDWLAEAHDAGALADLSGSLGVAPPEDYPGGWTDSLLRHQRFGAAVLGLPFHDGPECLLYRTDLLAAVGLTPPKTWDEFRRAARKLSVPRARQWGAVVAAYPDGHNTVYDFCVQLWSRGGELFAPDGRLRLNTPEVLEALETYRAILAEREAIHPDCRALDSVRAGAAFARGEAAMMVNWFGFAVLAETAPDSQVRGKVAIAPIPAAPGHASATLNVYWVLGVGAGSPHAAEAYGFLRHCASREGDKRLALGGGVGCRRSTWTDPDVRRVVPFYPEMERLHAGARELPRLRGWDRMAAVIDRLVVRALDEPGSLAKGLASAQAEADALG